MSDEPAEIQGEVLIQKTDANALGIGSYGAVYRAKIGQLPCAAKILHPTLLQIGDAGSDRILTLFEQECRVLRRIRHPHVIQYIKSYQDEHSRLPILLMELMDESLTHYLENLRTAVPHHIQLNIAHDVALALEFLHSIGIIHRDLSSNNVLLIAGKRAKVTDFGMAKLLEGHTRLTPATFCPGTMAYMPPEALKAEPTYSEKLDCFSAGVVFLQILTRQFPAPGVRSVQVNDERYPTGIIEMPIPELDRRQTQISMVVPQDHPLLLIARECMNDQSFMRPSAGEICSRIEALKSTSWIEYVAEREGEGEEGEGGESDGEGGADVGRMSGLRHQLEESQSLLEVCRSCLEEARLEVTQKEREIDEMRQKLVKQEAEHAKMVKNLTESIRERQEKLLAKDYELERSEEHLAARDTRIAELERQVKEQQTDFQQRDHLSLPLKPHSHSTSSIPSLPARSPTSPSSPQLLELKWKLHGAARKIEGDSSAVCESTAYFTDGSLVVVFNCLTEEWTTLPPCPKTSFAIVVVCGLPTAVGGFKPGEGNVKSLLSLTGEGHGRSWSQVYPAMEHPRNCPAAICTGHLLVVAGSFGSEENGRSVEVLDTHTMAWSVAASLPFPFWRATAITCGNRLYIGGGVKDRTSTGCLDVLYCTLSDLQSRPSSSPSTVGRKLRNFRITTPKVWHTAAKLPMQQSTLVCYQGHLFAVGGQLSNQTMPVSDVYCYSPSANEWKLNGHMVRPRTKCFVVALPNGRLMALGGSVEPFTVTDSIEIASMW